MKTINVTDEEQAELLKLRAKKTAQATSTEFSDVVRAAGTSEGAKKGWLERANHANSLSAEAHKATARADETDTRESHSRAETLNYAAENAHKEAAEVATPDRKAEHETQAGLHGRRCNFHQRAATAAKASDTTNTEVVHCRSHSAAGSVLAADKPWNPGEQVEFMWMPAGTSTICAGFRKGSIELTVNCDENTAAAVQASLESWREERPKQEPFGCIEHKEQEASFRVGASCGFKWNDDGVYLAAEPTTLGAQNVNGRVHRSWSPSFTTDADYSKATERGGVLMFPEGARGSRSNPAQITGVDFCVGTLTNKPAFHSMSPVKASDAVQAGGQPGNQNARGPHSKRANDASDIARKATIVTEGKPTMESHGKASDAHYAAAGAHEKAVEMEVEPEVRKFHHEAAAHHYSKVDFHETQMVHMNRAARASDTTSSESITAHCAETLKQDVPDATPAEVACYEKCLENGGSHTIAVEEIRKQRNPAAKASLEEIYDKVTAVWSDAARKAAAEARKNNDVHTELRPYAGKYVNIHHKESGAVLDTYNTEENAHSAAALWEKRIDRHYKNGGGKDRESIEKFRNSINASLNLETTPDTILARQASVLEQANAIATEHGVARTTLDDVYSKCAVTATSEAKATYATPDDILNKIYARAETVSATWSPESRRAAFEARMAKSGAAPSVASIPNPDETEKMVLHHDAMSHEAARSGDMKGFEAHQASKEAYSVGEKASDGSGRATHNEANIAHNKASGKHLAAGNEDLYHKHSGIGEAHGKESANQFKQARLKKEQTGKSSSTSEIDWRKASRDYSYKHGSDD